MNVVCPFHVHMDKVPPLGTTLRVMAVYANPNDVRSVVKRCLIHMDPYNATNSKSIIPAVHVIRCESPCAAYKEDPTTGRHSVVIEYNNPEAGMGYRVYHYRFMCLSSCSSGEGMNRRPIKIIFTLEHGNCVLGRLSMDVKICRCPGRDRRNEDKSRLPPTSSTDQAKGQKKRKPNGKSTGIEVPPKTKKLSPSDTENDQQDIFQLQCSSRAIFDALRPIRDALEFYSTQHVDGRCCPDLSSTIEISEYFANEVAAEAFMPTHTPFRYDESLKKLFVKLDMACPFRVHLKREPPIGTTVRVMAVFSQPNDAMKPVKRCIRHMDLTDATNQTGTTCSTIHLRFMCLNSCTGGDGMNRRPIKAVFTLEHGDVVLGRLSMDVKVCACPTRDRRNEDKARLKLDVPTGVPDLSVEATTTSAPGDSTASANTAACAQAESRKRGTVNVEQ
ncbi:cellular tumor antigen P53, putative [Ixodes scapularis]|uniref:Cellular tumor antigen P53, putative n=1 Tax=Ixodes scapularis TaxID=6945 RepID=B7QF52_IXOSC|nr:cellular tumor antigen P53, putative [Ixodes scapularis]|eukprot:XP_002414166.1 cellular tumor antigen P53, putative [Ixodes scapularis]